MKEVKELRESSPEIYPVDIGLVVNEIIKMIEESKEIRFRKGSVSKVIELGQADGDNSWRYFLTYYPSTGDFTISLKRFKNQSNSFAILKITDKITEVESFEDFIERVGKAYLILKDLKKRYLKREIEEVKKRKQLI